MTARDAAPPTPASAAASAPSAALSAKPAPEAPATALDLRFSAFGLVWSAPFPMPGAARAPDGARPDVVIRRGALPPPRPGAVAGPFWRIAEDGSAWFLRDGLAALVEDGARVTLDHPSGWSDRRAALETIYGPLVAVLHQRAILSLHASAMAAPEAAGGGAAVFIGAPGAGKSTLAGLLAAEGWRAAGDDVVAIDVAGPGPPAVPCGFATARLFADSAASAGAAGRSVSAGGRGLGKEVVALPAADAPWRAPLAAVLFLEWVHPPSAPARAERLAPLEALARLREAVFRPEFALPLGLSGPYLKALAAIVSAVPAYVLRRPRAYGAAGDSGALVRRLVAGGEGTAPPRSEPDRPEEAR